MDKLTIVLPSFNEEEVLPSTLERLFKIEDKLIEAKQITTNSNIMIVDDGSKDRTWEITQKANQVNSRIAGVKFSRNFGHQNALIAGLQEASKTADIIITIDADLQDDPDVIPDMVQKYHEGAEIVYGVRNDRESDSWFKRNTAELYYKMLRLLGVNLIPDHADFRLMSKRAVATFLEFPERNMFIRGLIPMLGFKSEKVYYKRTPRLAGESKYPLRKMLGLAWDGITSLSIAPVRLVLLLGGVISILGIIMLIYTLIVKLAGFAEHGWSSMMVSIWIIGGFQMVSLGIVGEYVGKMMTEVKRRPRFTIEKRIGD